MAKAYSKAAKRRAKKQLPDLAPVERREKKSQGRARMQEIKQEREGEAMRTVLEARARHMGRSADKLSEMRTAALGEPAGRAIYKAHDGERAAELWRAYAGLTAAEAVYMRHYLGLRLHAKTAKVEYLIEIFETRPDDRPDLRDEEQKSRDASNNWARWRGYLMQLPRYHQQRIFDVAYGATEPMAEGKLTSYGRDFVESVERLAEAVADRE